MDQESSSAGLLASKALYESGQNTEPYSMIHYSWPLSEAVPYGVPWLGIISLRPGNIATVLVKYAVCWLTWRSRPSDKSTASSTVVQLSANSFPAFAGFGSLRLLDYLDPTIGLAPLSGRLRCSIVAGVTLFIPVSYNLNKPSRLEGLQ